MRSHSKRILSLTERISTLLVLFSLLFISITPQAAHAIQISQVGWQEYIDPYWQFKILYPPAWKLQSSPYVGFGFWIASPELQVDPGGRPLIGGYLSINVIEKASPSELADFQQSAVGDFRTHTEKGITISGKEATQIIGDMQDGLSSLITILYVEDDLYVFRFVSTKQQEDDYLQLVSEMLNSVEIIGEPVSYPAPIDSADRISLEAFSLPPIKHAFAFGPGRIISGYGHQSGSNQFAFDLCEGNQCSRGYAGDVILAPTQMTLTWSGQGNGMPSTSKDLHIFEIANDGQRRLCMQLGHLEILVPGFIAEKMITVPQGAAIGKLVNYTPSIPHIHMGLWTVPSSDICATSNYTNRVAVPFDENNGGYSLDGVSYKAGENHKDKDVNSTNAPFCWQPPQMAVTTQFDSLQNVSANPDDCFNSLSNETKVTDIPNPDTYSCFQPGYIDFEGLREATNLSALTITGIQFTTTNGYSWRVGDFSTGNYNGKYPSGGYTSQGTHWAWLGTTQGAGRIDFPKGATSYFSLLVSSNTSVSLDAYSANGVKLATAGPTASNYFTGHMTELKITRATADIAYVMVHDAGNYFEIDSICTNAPGIPSTINQVLDQNYFMRTGQQVSGNFFLDTASGFWRYLRIFIGPFNSDVDLVITRPDGTVVNPGDPGFVLDKTSNYIEAIVDGANAGNWNYQIIANQLDAGGENIQITVGEQLVDSANEIHLVDAAGVFRPSNGLLYLRNAPTTGFADIAINYGLPGDYPVVGDWDGNGTATIGIYRNGSFYLRNSNTRGFANFVFAFGQPGDQPVAGDWDGNGTDTIGIYRQGTFYLRNTNSSGAPDMVFALGNAWDVGIAGDWNGDGLDTTGVFRPSNGVIFLKNANTTGFADIALNYGLPGDKPVMGDWDNDGIDTIGIYRNGRFYLRNSNTNGFADIVFALGISGDIPIAGNWDGLP